MSTVTEIPEVPIDLDRIILAEIGYTHGQRGPLLQLIVEPSQGGAAVNRACIEQNIGEVALLWSRIDERARHGGDRSGKGRPENAQCAGGLLFVGVVLNPFQGVVPLHSIDSCGGLLTYQEYEKPMGVSVVIALSRRSMHALSKQNQARTQLSLRRFLVLGTLIAPTGVFRGLRFPRKPGRIVSVTLILSCLLDCIDGSIELQIQKRVQRVRHRSDKNVYVFGK